MKKLLLILIIASCSRPQTDLRIYLREPAKSHSKLTISVSCGRVQFDTTFFCESQLAKILKVDQGKKYTIKIVNQSGVNYTFGIWTANSYTSTNCNANKKVFTGVAD